MKKLILVLLAIILNVLALGVLLFLADFYTQQTEAPLPQASSNLENTLNLSFVGDLMCHEPQYLSAMANSSYDFQPPFRLVAPFLAEADMAFGNLETVFGGDASGKKYSGFPAFNTPDAYATALAKAGFDALFTANNHSLDGGTEGIQRTIQVLAENGLPAIGTFESARDTSSVQIYDLKNIKFSVFAYTEISNAALPAGQSFMLNMIDTARIRSDFARARSKGAEIIIVNFHFGTEYERDPNEYQKSIVRHAIKCGADIIVGQHPHVLQPIWQFKGSENCQLDTGIVAFSLGNFYAHQLGRYTNSGMILNIQLEKNPESGEIRIANQYGIPTYTAIYQKDGKRQYLIVHSSLSMQRLLPKRLRKSLPPESQWLSAEHFHKMEQAFEDAQELLKTNNKQIEIK